MATGLLLKLIVIMPFLFKKKDPEFDAQKQFYFKYFL